MFRRQSLNFGLFVPMLAALLLVIAVSCGGSATSTAVPQATAVAVAAATAVPAAATAVPAAATAVPAAVPAATTAPALMAGPTGEINLAFPELGVYKGHPTLAGGATTGITSLAAYESLVGRDIDGKLVNNMLAESWSTAPDNVTWTFKLKEGIQFHAGVGEFTAEDVVWSVTASVAEGSIFPDTGQVRRSFFNPAGHFKQVDRYTIEVNTGTPQWDLLVWVTGPGTEMFNVSKKQVEELVASVGLDAANSKIVGTGPWELTEARTGEFWKYKAFPDHHRKVPEFAEMTFFEIPEESTRIANFQVGKVDLIQPAPDSISAVSEVPGMVFMSQPGGSHSHLGLYGSWYETSDGNNCPEGAAVCPAPGYSPDKLPYVSSNSDIASPEWEQARKVREAMAIAIDREKIVEELLGGEGAASSMWGWLGHESREQSNWTREYDIDRAKQLMKEAGYEDGFEVELTTSIRGVAVETEACEAVGDMWADIGITARLQKIPYGSIRPSMLARTLEGITCHALFPVPSPLIAIGYIFDYKSNWSGGSDHASVTPLLAAANDTFDDEDRWKITQELGSLIWDNVLDIGLYSQNTVYALSSKLDPWLEHLSTSDPRRISALEWATPRK